MIEIYCFIAHEKAREGSKSSQQLRKEWSVSAVIMEISGENTQQDICSNGIS